MQINIDKPLLQSLLTNASIVEARDAYTGGHLWRVSQFAKLVAESLELNKNDTYLVEIGGFLHDLGKVGVPDAILNKHDKLTDAEYNVIKTHPLVGARVLGQHPLLPLCYEAITCHHEQPSGKGYPNGLQENELSFIPLIIGVCDAFDAMTSTRPYRDGMPIEKAAQIIAAESGQQFGSQYADALIGLIGKGRLEHIVGHSEAGIPLLDCPMCGPTVVINREHKSGDEAYCRACHQMFLLEEQNGFPGGFVLLKKDGVKASAELATLHTEASAIEDMVARAPRVIELTRTWGSSS